MTVWIIGAILFSACVALFLVAPFYDPALGSSASGAPVGVAPALLDSKERALRALKDLELDRSMGKVSEEDFAKSRQELLREVATILEETRGRAG